MRTYPSLITVSIINGSLSSLSLVSPSKTPNMDNPHYSLDKSNLSQLGLDQFCKLSKESQSLAMFEVLEENRNMLELILSSGQRRNPNAYDDKVDTVEINIGGSIVEVILSYYDNDNVPSKTPGTTHHHHTVARDQAVQGY